MIVVHHLGMSQSERVIWLCEELGIPYELKLYQRDSQTGLAPAGYRALAPMGIAPVISDGDLVLGESGAIVTYLIARHGGGRLAAAPDSPNYPAYLYWFHFANATMMPNGMLRMVIPMVGGDLASPGASWINDREQRIYEVIEQRLGEAAWLAGDEFSAADIMIAFPLTTLRMMAKQDLGNFPNIRAYLQRIGERPAYRKMVELGDPGWTPYLS